MKGALLYGVFYLCAAGICSAGISEYLFFEQEAFLVFLLYWLFPLIGFSILFLGVNCKLNSYKNNRLEYSISFWLILVVVDFIFAGYIPIVNILTSDGGLYTEFKPPLHGLTNAISLSIVCFLPFSTFRKKNLIAAIIIGYQLIILNRGPLIYHLLAYVTGCIFVNKKYLNLKKIVLWLIGVLILFSFVGSLRSGFREDVDIHELFGITSSYGWLPGAVVWIIIYFSSPISNLLYNISLEEVTCSSGVSAVLSSVIPGFLRNAYLEHDVMSGNNLACEITGQLYYAGLNVSTGFVQYFIDFGKWGLTISSLITAMVLYRISKTYEKWDALNSLLIVLLFVSIFAPAYNQLSFMAAFIIIKFGERQIETR
jgi:hypothetical protein